ncbi:hypothetical protein PAXRUDRAFT_157048 [Paxillus rubicundulus Ve08.2h10]|uniref:Myb/SANT-like domain-containing protein n=1 Tax=Paxillus rubicundulus Ve08.2h10 TaxID=930991 RepID=A0A0D0DPS2_9AGAM|nr:hypothetical protein PAXRUDRAFT_157048 [Paxillus rubicundulus Ve08.2h10]
MADQTSTPEGSSDKARWMAVEVTALVDYLYKHHAECGNAGNFKEPTYNAAAVHIKPYFNGVGAVKTGKMVGYKWGTLKAIYNTIKSYCRVKSGCHWDNKNGANIQGVDQITIQLLTLHIYQTNVVMRPFQNSGWEHYKKISEIFPSGGATGGMAFNTTMSSVPSKYHQ